MIDLSKVKIEKNIPIAIPFSRTSRSPLVLLFGRLKVGDSMVLPLKLRNYMGVLPRMLRIKITSRKLNDREFRVWRTE